VRAREGRKNNREREEREREREREMSDLHVHDAHPLLYEAKHTCYTDAIRENPTERIGFLHL